MPARSHNPPSRGNDRDSYAEVGQAFRRSVQAANRANLPRRTLEVLNGVWSLTVSWSRLSTRASAGQIAIEAGLWDGEAKECPPWLRSKVGQHLRKLDDAGAIAYQPGGKEGWLSSRVTLPPETQGHHSTGDPRGAQGLRSTGDPASPVDRWTGSPVDGRGGSPVDGRPLEDPPEDLHRDPSSIGTGQDTEPRRPTAPPLKGADGAPLADQLTNASPLPHDTSLRHRTATRIIDLILDHAHAHGIPTNAITDAITDFAATAGTDTRPNDFLDDELATGRWADLLAHFGSLELWTDTDIRVGLVSCSWTSFLLDTAIDAMWPDDPRAFNDHTADTFGIHWRHLDHLEQLDPPPATLDDIADLIHQADAA